MLVPCSPSTWAWAYIYSTTCSVSYECEWGEVWMGTFPPPSRHSRSRAGLGNFRNLTCVRYLIQDNTAEDDPKGRLRPNSPSEPWVLLSMETPAPLQGKCKVPLLLTLTELSVCRAVSAHNSTEWKGQNFPFSQPPQCRYPHRVGHLPQWKSLADSHHSQSLPCTGGFCERIQLGDGTCPPL